jgi:hypothetical protein
MSKGLPMRDSLAAYRRHEMGLISRAQFLALTMAALTPLIFAPAAARSLREELIALEERRQDAYVSGDRAELALQFAEEYVHTNLRGGRTDKPAELAFYTPGRFRLKTGQIDDVAAHQYGDVATMIATVTWVGAEYRPNPATIIDLSGRYSVSRVYVRRDGRWQLALSHASQIPAEQQ